MNFNKYACVSMLLTLTLASCSDKEIPGGEPAKTGDEVRFGAKLTTSNTRTYYGSDDLTAASWPIYWNNKAKGQTLDDIFVFSPQCAAGRNQAYYQVIAEQESPVAQEILKKSTIGVQWGSSETADFYGFYPGSDAFNLSVNGTVLTATLPGAQTATIAAGSTDTSVNPGGYTYVGTPDMNNMMMVASSTGKKEDESVSLPFKPLSTMLDITIYGPVDNNTVVSSDQNWARVTSVTITADAQITGTFTYDYSTGEIKAESSAAGDNTISISTMVKEDGAFVGTRLTNNQTLNVKAFLIPNDAVKNLKITVTTSQNQVWSKNLKMTGDNNQIIFKPSQINPVKLPKLSFAEAEFDFSTWISQLDPRIYISEISLPGSALSFNSSWNGISGNDATQSLKIEDQFNEGVRVFQGHINKNLDIVTSSGQTCNYNGKSLTLSVAAGLLVDEMRSTHSDEFCVFMISDYGVSSDDYPEMLKTFKQQLEDSEYHDYYATKVDAETTIEDVKGKVLLFFHFNGMNVSGSCPTALKYLNEYWAPLGTEPLFTNWWMESAGESLQYSPLFYANAGKGNNLSDWTNYSYYNTSEDSNKPTFTSGGGTVGAAGQKIYNGASWSKRFMISGYYWSSTGSLEVTSKPSASALASGMWYIYTEQANAGKYYNDVLNNINNTVSAINSCYVTGQTNKYFMTYCGGTGNENHIVTNVSNALTNRWTTQIANITNKPYGWVLFNQVGSNDNVAKAIQTVINNNNKDDFKLHRDTNKGLTTKSSPTGDVTGTSHGGSLF